MRAKIILAFLLVGLVVGCEPEPPTGTPADVSSAAETMASATTAPGDAVASETPVIAKLRANAQALCARQNALAERSSSWFACSRASAPADDCPAAQLEAGRLWIERLQIETIEGIGAEAALECFAGATDPGIPTLGELPRPEDWLTDYLEVNRCARDRLERARAEAPR